MIYIDNNEKLATLIEKLIVPGKATELEIIEAKELISDLRSPHGDVHLVDSDKWFR